LKAASVSVLVVIVNYRTGRLVTECLRSLEAEVRACADAGLHAAVTVVDNASGDGSGEAIAAAIESNGWSDWARLLPSALNGGFSYGNNLAVRLAMASAAPPRLFWILNPDTLVRPGALRAMTDFLQDRPEVGIVGSALEAQSGEPWPYAFRFPSVLSEVEAGARLGLLTRLLSRHAVVRPMGAQPEKVDWLPGASMLVRREVFEAIGLMDEDYFLYYEETDFFLQAQRAGWESWYVPASRVMHIAGQSTGVTGNRNTPKRLPAYWFESRRRYFVKNHGRFYAAVADVMWTLSYLSWRVRRALQRKPDNDPPRLLRDFLAHSALLHGGLPINPAMRQWQAAGDVAAIPKTQR
jgi:hypothetical protein